MKRQAIATLLSTAAVLASVPAHALTLECGIISQTPAPSPNETPVYKIWVEVVDMGGKLVGMTARHFFVDATTVQREDQYIDREVRATKTEITWQGRYIKDPSVTMTGNVKIAKDKVVYTERRFEQNRLVWTMAAQCHPVTSVE